ncbi:MAG: hypothetical protein FH757_12760 [Alcanivorax sp.]|jgi:hypothetical protein|nr:hypothetical protein [Alcanivorax sp.]
MSLSTRQRLFVLFVALTQLGLGSLLTLNGYPGVPLGVIGVALLPLAWLAGRHPATPALPRHDGDHHAA